MSFFDKIEDVMIVDMFKQVFQWLTMTVPQAAEDRLLSIKVRLDHCSDYIH